MLFWGAIPSPQGILRWRLLARLPIAGLAVLPQDTGPGVPEWPRRGGPCWPLSIPGPCVFPAVRWRLMLHDLPFILKNLSPGWPVVALLTPFRPSPISYPWYGLWACSKDKYRHFKSKNQQKVHHEEKKHSQQNGLIVDNGVTQSINTMITNRHSCPLGFMGGVDYRTLRCFLCWQNLLNTMLLATTARLQVPTCKRQLIVLPTGSVHTTGLRKPKSTTFMSCKSNASKINTPRADTVSKNESTGKGNHVRFSLLRAVFS